MNKKLKILLIIFGLIMLCAIYVTFIWLDLASPGLLKVAFLDVGQGDAIFIETPSGNQVLIDGGPAGGFGGGSQSVPVLGELSEVMGINDKDIDIVIATHPHADHIQGLNKIFDYYSVDMIVDAGVDYESKTATEWESNRVRAKQYKEVSIGDSIDLGDGVALDFVYPERISTKVKNKAHDKMVVALLRYRDFRLLLTGDLEGYNEDDLRLASGEKIQAQFLKVAHHGSRNSTTSEFLDNLSPHIGFISVASKNRYGHPHQQTLDKLNDYGVRYYRTDIGGTINLATDGFYYKIASSK